MSERPGALLARLARVSPLAHGIVALGAVLAGLSSLALLGQAIAIGDLVGALFAHAHAGLAPGLWLLGAASALRALAGSFGPVLNARLAAPVRRELRRRLLVSVLDTGPRESRDAEAQLAGRGVEAVESYLARYVPALASSIVTPTLLVAWLAWRDWLSGAIVILAVALLPLFMALLGAEAKAKMDESFAEQQRLASYFGDVVRGMGTLKAHNRSSDAVDSLGAVGDSLRRSTMHTLRVAFLSSFALELLSSLATALVAMELGLRLLHGQVGLAQATTILVITPEVFLPLRRVAAAFHASASGVAAAGALLGRLAAPRGPGAPAPRAYPGLVLRDALVEPGQMLVVTGASGAGKTRLLRALLTLSDVAPGLIHVDGHDLADLDRDDWRRQVAWLSQDAPLHGRTVREALTLGETRFSDDVLRANLQRVGLDVELDRPIGEGDGTLSAGQRRRLALARCLVREPLVLVLDEPTAHLDPHSAEQIAALIAALPMTRVVASHRPLVGDATLALGPS